MAFLFCIIFLVVGYVIGKWFSAYVELLWNEIKKAGKRLYEFIKEKVSKK